LAEARLDLLRELSLKRVIFVLSDRMPRYGKEILPKRASVNGHYFRLSSPRLGKGSSPERESLSPERDPSA